MTLHPIPLNFLIYEENFLFFFISARSSKDPGTSSGPNITLIAWVQVAMVVQKTAGIQLKAVVSVVLNGDVKSGSWYPRW
jgi:hypothetical protein